MMRSTFLYSLVAAAAALTIAGCGGGSDHVPPPAPAPAPAPAPVNAAPTADAGSAQSIVTGATVTLDGTKSSDADGDKLTYAWTLTSKPAGSDASLTGTTASNPTFVADVTGTYVATLVVSDGSADSTPSTVTITAGTVIGFDSLTPLPFNMPSYGPEAYAFASIGDNVTLQSGSPHTIGSINIGMSSWACQTGDWTTTTGDCVSAPGATFDLPVTVTVFDSNNHQVATKTQTFAMPYRPSADPACTGTNAGKWKGPDGVCYNGFGFEITFDLTALKATLPDDTLSYTVSYNTDHHGLAPLGGTNSPSDSLNVGVTDAAPSVGSYPSSAPTTHLIWSGISSEDTTGYGIMAQFQMMNP